MKRRILCLCLLSLAAVARAWDQNLVSGKVPSLSLDPDAPAWSKAETVRVRVAPQGLVVPQGGGKVPYVDVQSLRTPKEIYFRLRWPDPKKDSTFELSGRFVDACAIQFPLAPGTPPSPFMGEKGRAVNIWRWSAAMQESVRHPKAYADYHRPDAIEKTVRYPDRPEDLVAEGFGTLGRRETQPVEGRGAWARGTWAVVLRRSLSSAGGTPFPENAVLPFAVAVWDGSGGERDGAKSFSVWQNLLLDHPAPALTKNVVERGRRVYARYGCAACHGPDGKGGIANPGAQVDPVPSLDRVAEGFSEDELKTVIRNGRMPVAKDPNGPQPRLWMNAWKNLMDEEELDALADYLMSLLPVEKRDEW